MCIYAKCGANCVRCPSYKNNLLTRDDRKKCSEGWYRYHNFRINPEKLVACDGCQPIGENGNGTRYINCIIRRCALYNEVKNCAFCSAYPCEVLTSRVLGEEWLDRLFGKLGKILEDDYKVYVEPYLVMPILDGVRARLDPDNIKEINEIVIKPQLTAYPVGLESGTGYGTLYQLLQNLNTPVAGISYAQAETQKERRMHILKILWTFGLYGKFNNERNCLLLDHKTYLAQKIHSNYDRVQNYFETLAGLGVHCEVIPLKEGNWLTPKRALRKQGVHEASPPWVMKMTIDEGIGGVTVIEALQQYASDLNETFGRTAYRRFGRADMRIMRR